MDWTLATTYIAFFLLGVGVLVIQIVLTMIGGDHGGHDGVADAGAPTIGHADAGEAHVGDTGMSLLSVRSVAAFLAGFGIVGWMGTDAGWSPAATLVGAIVTGFVMLLLTAWIFATLWKLQARGNLDPSTAVGKTASVYLKVPAENRGKGKITLSLQGRSAEFAAFTTGPEILSGREVRIVRQVTQDTFEVEPL